MRQPHFLIRQLIIHVVASIVSASCFWVVMSLAPHSFALLVSYVIVLSLLTAFFPVPFALILRPTVLVVGTLTGGLSGFCLGCLAWGGAHTLGTIQQYSRYAEAVKEDDPRGAMAMHPALEKYVFPLLSAAISACLLALIGYWLSDFGNRLQQSTFAMYLFGYYRPDAAQVLKPSFATMVGTFLVLEVPFAAIFRLSLGLLAGGFTIPQTSEVHVPQSVGHSSRMWPVIGIVFVTVLLAIAAQSTDNSQSFGRRLALASRLAREGKFEEAIRVADEALQEVRRQNNNRPERVKRAERVVGIFYTVTAENLYNRSQRYQDTIDVCSKALDVYPSQPDAHYYKGAAFYALGKDDEALSSWEAALGLDPEHARTLLDLAIHHHIDGNEARALDEIQRAINCFDKRQRSEEELFAKVARRLAAEWTSTDDKQPKPSSVAPTP